MNESIRHYSKADVKAQAIVEVENLIDGGSKVRAAVEQVAYRTGIAERSLFRYLQKTRGVPHVEREEALARKPRAPRPKVICHPEAMQRLVELCRSGMWVTDCYRKMKAEAEAKGWSPIPSERTLRRELDRLVPLSDRWMARRTTKPETGGASNV